MNQKEFSANYGGLVFTLLVCGAFIAGGFYVMALSSSIDLAIGSFTGLGITAIGCWILTITMPLYQKITISDEALQIGKSVYPWKNVDIKGFTKETVNHKVMFVPVASTTDEYMEIRLEKEAEENEERRQRRFKLQKRIFPDYREMCQLILQNMQAMTEV